MPITGYYDGTVVRTDVNFKLNQRVLIIPIENMDDEDTAAGMLHEYANTDLIDQENDAWRQAVVARYDR